MRIASAILTLAMVAAGCGGSAAGQPGRDLYVQRCAGCHGISAQALTPDPAAPNLLAGNYDADMVRRAVAQGRPGMPAGLLEGELAERVVRYLAAAGR